MDRDIDLADVRSALGGIARDMDYVLKEIEGWPDALPGPDMRADVARVCSAINNSIRSEILPEVGALAAKLATPPGLRDETANLDPAINARMITDWTRSDVKDFVALVERVRAASMGSPGTGWMLCLLLLEETAVNLARRFSDVEVELAPLAASAGTGPEAAAGGAS